MTALRGVRALSAALTGATAVLLLAAPDADSGPGPLRPTADTTPGPALLHGVVIRPDSTPLPDARVQVMTTGLDELRSVRTSGDGTFRIESLPARRLYVVARADRYLPGIRGPIAFGEADTVEVRLTLQPRRARPDSVAIQLEAERNPRLASVGFYRRRARTSGHFMTEKEILESGASTLSGAVNQLVSGVEVARTPAGNGVVLPGGQQTFGEPCYPLVYVDGTQVGRAGPANKNTGMVSLDNLVDVESLSGVEAYASASEVPGAYSGMESRCGVLLLWTRTR